MMIILEVSKITDFFEVTDISKLSLSKICLFVF
jgi:hypothetical protein